MQCDPASLGRTFSSCPSRVKVGPVPGTGWLPSFPARLLAYSFTFHVNWLCVCFWGTCPSQPPAFVLIPYLASSCLSFGVPEASLPRQGMEWACLWLSTACSLLTRGRRKVETKMGVHKHTSRLGDHCMDPSKC